MAQITMKIDDQMIEDLIVTAIEGGSNYWYFLSDEAVETIEQHTDKDKGVSLSEKLFKAIQNGAAIPINDLENTDEVLGKISMESCTKALQIMSDKYPFHLTNLISENWDGETADVFFQIAVMEDIVFG